MVENDHGGDLLPVTMPKPFWLDLLPPLLQKILS